MTGNGLLVVFKQLDSTYKSGFYGVKITSKVITQDLQIKEDNILQYHFINIGTKNVKINEVEIFSSFPFLVPPPQPQLYELKPAMNSHEIDSTTYNIKFQP